MKIGDTVVLSKEWREQKGSLVSIHTIQGRDGLTFRFAIKIDEINYDLYARLSDVDWIATEEANVGKEMP